jgi:excisionase family DNA binding protein
MGNIESLIIYPNVYYTVEETAQLLRVSQKTVLQLLRSEKAHGIKIGRQWRILGKALLDLSTPEAAQTEVIYNWLEASKSSLREVWDNEEDAIYDQV